jgi:hypothetical protein
VTGLIAELRRLAGRCADEVLLGRETGPRFWTRFETNIAALQHVVERDNWYAKVLEDEELKLFEGAK